MRLQTPAGRWGSSYWTELMALESALRFYRRLNADPAPAEMRICTDSQSALTRLKEGAAAQPDLLADRVCRRLHGLASRGTHLTLQWVPPATSWPTRRRARLLPCARTGRRSTSSRQNPDSGATHIGSGRNGSDPPVITRRSARGE